MVFDGSLAVGRVSAWAGRAIAPAMAAAAATETRRDRVDLTALGSPVGAAGITARQAPVNLVRRQWPLCGRATRLGRQVVILRGASSHVRVVRPATTFRRHPFDVLRGILDVAGLAVDAVLRVDHEARV